MCTLLPENDYQYLLDNKIDKIKSLFGDFSLPELSIYPSQKKHYRMRAEFRIWHEEDEIYHIMFDSKTKQRKRVDVFPTASKLINEAMKAIIPLLKYNETLRYQLFQIDYLSTLSGELLISLLYHKKLNDEWVIEAKQLKKSLNELGLNVNLIGRASSQKICLDQDYVDEKLDVLNQTLIYRQVENSFTQPNAKININMLTWAIQSTKESLGDLLELYCGNGNFSIALAQNFEHVIATEIAKTSVKSAQHNIKVNRTDNVKIVRLSAEEFTQAMNNERTFNRLNGICLSDYQFNTVLVDPPRSGLDDKTLLMISKYKTIIYISCNPLTLKENLTILSQTHEIKYMAAFDQFPYTDHLELGVILKRK